MCLQYYEWLDIYIYISNYIWVTTIIGGKIKGKLRWEDQECRKRLLQGIEESHCGYGWVEEIESLKQSTVWKRAK